MAATVIEKVNIKTEVTMNKELEKLEIYPAFENLIPEPSTEERDLLEKNIEENKGCLNPIIVWGDKIVDGNTRYNICRLANSSREEGEKLQYSVKRIEFASENEAKIWIIRNQFGRRNLDNYQRAKLALSLKEIFAKKAKDNQRASGGAVPQKSDKPVDTVKELASIAGVSHDTMNKVEKIEAEASEKDREKLNLREISINSLHNKLKKKGSDESAPVTNEGVIIRRTKIIYDNATKMSEEKEGDIPSSCIGKLQLSMEMLEKTVSRASKVAA